MKHFGKEYDKSVSYLWLNSLLLIKPIERQSKNGYTLSLEHHWIIFISITVLFGQRLDLPWLLYGISSSH